MSQRTVQPSPPSRPRRIADSSGSSTAASASEVSGKSKSFGEVSFSEVLGTEVLGKSESLSEVSLSEVLGTEVLGTEVLGARHRAIAALRLLQRTATPVGWFFDVAQLRPNVVR